MHKTVSLFANIVVRAWLTKTKTISKDQTMTAMQKKGKMIIAFKPSKPDKPRMHCLKRDKKDEKQDSLCKWWKLQKKHLFLLHFKNLLPSGI